MTVSQNVQVEKKRDRGGLCVGEWRAVLSPRMEMYRRTVDSAYRGSSTPTWTMYCIAMPHIGGQMAFHDGEGCDKDQMLFCSSITLYSRFVEACCGVGWTMAVLGLAGVGCVVV